MWHSKPLRLPDPYHYSKEDIHTLSDEDAVTINQLINYFPVMMDDKILDLALKNYDYSFLVPDDVDIILLVTCLEILFHPGDKDELKNRVARNAAVFLGDNTILSKIIFYDVKDYYDIRSSLVHSGIYKDKRKRTQKEIINDLRSIVSQSIIKYNIFVSQKRIKRDDFFCLLTSSGFDSNPFGTV
jgi:hypothetical protein